MKKKMVTALLAVSMLAGLSAVNVMAADDGGDTITVGFSQVGAESDWRTANTESMKSTFSEENGYELIFDDAQQKQENQLTAIRNFIQQEVDYIVLAPVTETGWDTVLQEAKDAGIPVITTNPTTHQNDLDGGDDTSVMAGTGTVDADPIEQAKVSATRAVDEVPENANVVVLKGPSGNYHADKRREAWDENFFSKRTDVNILYEDFANWNSDEALTLMESWVQAGTHIDAIISMNDNMAAGAIEAIRENKDYFNEDGTANFLAYGVDGTAQGCLLIKEGLLTSTALQSAADLAEKNLEYAEKVVNGEMEVTDVNDYVDAPEINADNVDDYIQIYIDNGELTEDDVKAAEE